MGCCLTILGVFFGILAIFKIWLKLVVSWDRSYTCLSGKTVIVTGANTGIGYHTALDLAKRGAKVILACRDRNKAEEARGKIIAETGNKNIHVKLVDFSSLESVREFAKDINDTEERLDILVNNAGAVGFDHTTTKDGLNYLMQINHFSSFLLTILLTGLLKKSAPSRIVNTSSIASHTAAFDVNNMNAFQNGNVNYSNSKLCNILFTNELARKLKGSGVVANSVHPGFVGTTIWKDLPTFTRIFLSIASCLFLRTPEEGAQTSIYVAASKEIEGVSGEYFDNGRIAWLPAMPKTGADEGLALKVWKKSEEFVKLTAEELKSFQ